MISRTPRTAPNIHDNRDKGALSKFDVSSNEICGLDEYGDGKYDTSGLSALAKAISNLKELNISNNYLKAEGAAIVAPALKDNGALSSLTFSGAKSESGLSVDGDPLTINISMTEADFSNKGLGQLGGAQILAAFMGSKNFKDNDGTS